MALRGKEISEKWTINVEILSRYAKRCGQFRPLDFLIAFRMTEIVHLLLITIVEGHGRQG